MWRHKATTRPWYSATVDTHAWVLIAADQLHLAGLVPAELAEPAVLEPF